MRVELGLGKESRRVDATVVAYRCRALLWRMYCLISVGTSVWTHDAAERIVCVVIIQKRCAAHSATHLRPPRSSCSPPVPRNRACSQIRAACSGTLYWVECVRSSGVVRASVAQLQLQPRAMGPS